MNGTGVLLGDQDGSVFGLNKDALTGAKGRGGETLQLAYLSRDTTETEAKETERDNCRVPNISAHDYAPGTIWLANAARPPMQHVLCRRAIIQRQHRDTVFLNPWQSAR